MQQAELNELLKQLISTWENEVVEFKQAGKDYDTNKIGEYFSALSNEANLRGSDRAWLVFGICNKTRVVVGSSYREEPERLHGLKQQIKENAEPSVTFREIHVLDHEQGRVVLFEIPAAPRGIPIAWKGHYYARAGESLSPLGLDKQDEIRQQTISQDWTAQVVADASLDDLDSPAVQRAREAFAQKHANRFAAEEVASWPLATFLDRARITQNGQITRAALLLLGKAESVWKLSPHPAQMTWKLEGLERAYEHFSPPFLLASSQLYQRIRNIQLRLLPEDELIPIEISKYDQKIVLEALHNCIAHQDYTRNARVVVIEQPDRLVFENDGLFFEGQPSDYLEGNRVPKRYRNPFLAQAMAELNMIDTMGYGIHDMYARQARRYFPMPDYDLSESGAVRLTIYGGVVDSAYSRLLIQKTDLPLADILALDRVQKQLRIPDEAASRLRRLGLIEGRKPNVHISAQVAVHSGERAKYIRNKAFDDQHYKQLIVEYLEKFGTAKRVDINGLLLDKLPDVLSADQKNNKVKNLLQALKHEGVIEPEGKSWRMSKAT